ncbi:MAG: EamA family transporter [Clostridia bacterium]|nr:EamA family transporter [Clostridia bacterium]
MAEEFFDGAPEATKGRKFALELKALLADAAFPFVVMIVICTTILVYASFAEDLTVSLIALIGGEVMFAGALVIFGERLNLMQWIGVLLGFWSLFFISRVGMKEGFSFKHSKWLWFSIGATFMGAVSALYDKYLLGQYKPLEVQAWYSLYQMIIMGVTIGILLRGQKERTPFHWSWAIPCISIFLTGADIAYFYALSLPGSMIAVVSMIRRGSVIVSFFYGVIALHEKHIKLKLIDLGILLIGLTFLVLGSR